MGGMQAGANVLEGMEKQMDIDEIQDLQDKMADQQQNVEERQQVFADIAANDMEEC